MVLGWVGGVGGAWLVGWVDGVGVGGGGGLGRWCWSGWWWGQVGMLWVVVGWAGVVIGRKQPNPISIKITVGVPFGTLAAIWLFH